MSVISIYIYIFVRANHCIPYLFDGVKFFRTVDKYEIGVFGQVNILTCVHVARFADLLVLKPSLIKCPEFVVLWLALKRLTVISIVQLTLKVF